MKKRQLYLLGTIFCAVVLSLGIVASTGFARVKSYEEITLGPGQSSVVFTCMNDFGEDITDFTIEIQKDCSGVAIKEVTVTSTQDGGCGDWDVDDNENGRSQEEGEKDNEDNTPKSGKARSSWYTRVDCRGEGDENPENKKGVPIRKNEQYTIRIVFTGKTKDRCMLFFYPSNESGDQISGCICGPMCITSFVPKLGLPGTIVEIQGNGFDSNPFNNTVTIGGSIARVISGDTTHLRVVALRDVATGPIVVQKDSETATSSTMFRREGSTAFATPLQDSDSELIEGVAYPADMRYDFAPIGLNQKVLVVLAKPSDIDPEVMAPPGKTAREFIIEMLDDANVYFDQASYGKLSADFTVTDWISLSQTHDYYCFTSKDIEQYKKELETIENDPNSTEEQKQDARNKVTEAQNCENMLQEYNFLFAEALSEAEKEGFDFDTYPDYLFVVAGPLRGAYYGPYPYLHEYKTDLGLKFDIDFAGPKGIAAVGQGLGGQKTDWSVIVHELSHFFGLGDLYTAGSLEGNAAHFAMMGYCYDHPLYIGHNIEQLGYFNKSNIKLLEWGSVPDFDESFDLVAHAKTEDPIGDNTFHLLRLKVTEGLFYYVEVRQMPDTALGDAADYVFDPKIPLYPSDLSWKGGVIIYKAVEDNNQSNNNEREVTLLPPYQMLQEGESFEDPQRTIKISIEQILADRPAKYRVRVEWGPLPDPDPNGQFDLRITPWGAPPWESPDIWANSIKNDQTNPPRIIYKNHEPGDDTKPIGNGDPPWVEHENTLFARITNEGTVPAYNVKVTFYVNAPAGVGDNETWVLFDTVVVGVINNGKPIEVETKRKWRPRTEEHTCVKVYIHPQHGEVTFGNNTAYENFCEFETAAESPCAPVEFDFLARNPYEAPIIMDLQAPNVPIGWFVAFNHGSVWLPPLGEKKVHVVVWTDAVPECEIDCPVPRKALINIEGWVNHWGDQVFPVGGITVLAQAVRKVNVEVAVEVVSVGTFGYAFQVGVQVDPSTGAVPIAIHITDPDGNLIVERTETDNIGRISYTTRYTVEKTGLYRIQVFLLGGTPAGETESEIQEILID